MSHPKKAYLSEFGVTSETKPDSEIFLLHLLRHFTHHSGVYGSNIYKYKLISSAIYGIL